MINKITDGWKKWGYAGVTREVFESCTEEIQNHNTGVVGKVLLMSIVLFALYTISGIWIPGFADMMPYYALFMLISIAMYLHHRHKVGAGRKCKFLQCYILVGVMFLFCLIKEVFIHSQWPGALFHVVLIGAFALFLMPFWHEVCFCGAISILYLLSAYMVKEPEVFQLEVANVTVSFGLAALTSYVVNRERISYILSKKLLTNSSTVDELTGVYNRRDFNEKVISSYDTERKLALLMIDVDNFKSYNDTYGHLEGDKCLHQIGNALGNVANSNGCYVARYGGEEFVILGSGVDLQGIRQIGWQAVTEIRKLRIENESSPLGIITISVGAAEKNEKRMNAYTDLIREADTALYRAKKAGKNRVEMLENV
ncbi:MAG: GGDEF domain-containing protein [Lachnospiraceae bacterium]|nr:GGDEF domain-containing protein [Lachnospiraceae bacterium]